MRLVWSVGAILIALGGVGSAVEEGKPSKTSVWVLAARAIGAHDPDPTVRNPDWLAEQFLGPAERALIPENVVMQGVGKDYREAMKEPETRARVLMTNIRTHFIDRRMLQAVRQGAAHAFHGERGSDADRASQHACDVRRRASLHRATGWHERRRYPGASPNTPQRSVHWLAVARKSER